MRRILSLLLALAACNDHFTPLQNRIAVGKGSYVVFVADGEGGQGDLYAIDAVGGSPWAFTFSLADESHPALDPTGLMVAFVRTPNDTDRAGRRIWVMNLLSGSERELPPLGAGVVPEAVAWGRDGRTIYVETAVGPWGAAAPPADAMPHRLTGPDSLAGDSALAVLVGEPPFAEVGPCAGGTQDLCAFAPGRPPALLDSIARDPLRWGGDSLGYFIGDRLVVRPVGPGRLRELRIEHLPPHPRQAAWFPGLPAPTAAR